MQSGKRKNPNSNDDDEKPSKNQKTNVQKDVKEMTSSWFSLLNEMKKQNEIIAIDLQESEKEIHKLEKEYKELLIKLDDKNNNNIEPEIISAYKKDNENVNLAFLESKDKEIFPDQSVQFTELLNTLALDKLSDENDKMSNLLDLNQNYLAELHNKIDELHAKLAPQNTNFATQQNTNTVTLSQSPDVTFQFATDIKNVNPKEEIKTDTKEETNDETVKGRMDIKKLLG